MSWYVLRCKKGSEQIIVNSCKRHLSANTLEEVFVFQCERLWKKNGIWKILKKDMFPGYVFLQSCQPEALAKELKKYGNVFQTIAEEGYLLSIYEEEERYLRNLCGKEHFLQISYGYKDKFSDVSYIIKGPLMSKENKILKLDWHKRLAQVEIPFLGNKTTIWVGLDIAFSGNENSQARAVFRKEI